MTKPSFMTVCYNNLADQAALFNKTLIAIGGLVMKYPAQYPQMPDFVKLQELMQEYARLKFEFGADRRGIERILYSAYAELQNALDHLRALPEDLELALLEPNDLAGIRRLRPNAGRVLWGKFDREKYRDRLAGAFYGRMAGCTLGAAVEFWTPDKMRDWAAYIGDKFPPEDYWSKIKNPNEVHYGASLKEQYTRPGIDGVPVDDDITYTILGLLIAEEYGLGFSTDDAGRAWVKYLPVACTAEEVALINMNAGICALSAADIDNPYVQWIGADIRSDPWGYMAPGLPEKAAEMAYRDAWLSHRRNGIYGEMYFSAAIAAAFETGDAIEALRLGLNEIPADCLLARDVRWALDCGGSISCHAEARAAVEARFGGMSGVHANLNACLTLFGLMIGGGDFTRCIGETVAMGYDNDCTAATAGSLFGAAHGIGSIPGHWTRPFHNKVKTYINGVPELAIDKVLDRFEALAVRAFIS
jgi:ADP-ribosylglycohydrolase